MGAAARHETEQAKFTHPRCPACAVPMWLMNIERDRTGNAARDRNRFECMVCSAVAVIPPLDS